MKPQDTSLVRLAFDTLPGPVPIERIVENTDLRAVLGPYLQGLEGAKLLDRADEVLDGFRAWCEQNASRIVEGTGRTQLNEVEEATIVSRLLFLDESEHASRPTLKGRRSRAVTFSGWTNSPDWRRVEDDGHHRLLWESYLGRLSAYLRDSARGLLSLSLTRDRGSHSTDPVDLSGLMTSISKVVDQPPSRYPVGLTPSKLWNSLALLDYEDWEYRPIQSRAQVLYAEPAARGGQPATALLGSERRVVVLGDPGSGKSTILAGYLANHLQDSGRGIFVRLPDLAREARLRMPKSLEEASVALVAAFQAGHPGAVSEEESRQLQHLVLNEQRFLICLDGLDEVSEKLLTREFLGTVHLLGDLPGSIVIASRLTGYSNPLVGAKEYVVCDLEDPYGFFDIWFPQSDSPGRIRVMEALRESVELRQMVKNPLMAGIVASVAEHSRVPRDQGALYQTYIFSYFERFWKPPDGRRRNRLKITRLMRAAREIAWSMAIGSHYPGSEIREWFDIASADWLLSIDSDGLNEIDTLLSIDGLLVAHGKASDADAVAEQSFRWLHRSIHEHLVGSYLANWYGREPREALSRIEAAFLASPKWSASLSHMLSLMSVTHQREVITGIQALADEFPFEIVMEQALHGLALRTPRSSLYRQAWVDRLIAQSNWEMASGFEPQRTADAILPELPDRLESGDVDDLLTVLSKWEVGHEETLTTVIERRLQMKVFGWGWGFAVVLLARSDPDRAVGLVVDELEAGNIRSSPLWNVAVSVATMNRVQNAFERSDFLTCPGYWSLLAGLEGGSDYLKDSEVAAWQANLSEVTSRMDLDPEIELHIPEMELESVLRGEYGEWAAHAAGRNWRTPIEVHGANPWARVMGYASSLAILLDNDLRARFSNGLGLLDSDRTQINEIASSNDDSTMARSRLQDFNALTRSSPTAVQDLLKSLHSCFIRKEVRALDDLLEAELSAHRRLVESDPVDPRTDRPVLPEMMLIQLLQLVQASIAASAEWEAIVPWLRSRVTNPILFNSRIDSDLDEITALLLSDKQDLAEDGSISRVSASDLRLIEVARWLQDSEIAWLRTLPRPREPDTFVDQLLADFQARFLASSTNLPTMVGWLHDEGLLPAYLPLIRKWKRDNRIVGVMG